MRRGLEERERKQGLECRGVRIGKGMTGVQFQSMERDEDVEGVCGCRMQDLSDRERELHGQRTKVFAPERIAGSCALCVQRGSPLFSSPVGRLNTSLLVVLLQYNRPEHTAPIVMPTMPTEHWHIHKHLHSPSSAGFLPVRLPHGWEKETRERGVREHLALFPLSSMPAHIHHIAPSLPPLFFHSILPSQSPRISSNETCAQPGRHAYR
jgi:hypothetical protein